MDRDLIEELKMLAVLPMTHVVHKADRRAMHEELLWWLVHAPSPELLAGAILGLLLTGQLKRDETARTILSERGIPLDALQRLGPQQRNPLIDPATPLVVPIKDGPIPWDLESVLQSRNIYAAALDDTQRRAIVDRHRQLVTCVTQYVRPYLKGVAPNIALRSLYVRGGFLWNWWPGNEATDVDLVGIIAGGREIIRMVDIPLATIMPDPAARPAAFHALKRVDLILVGEELLTSAERQAQLPNTERKFLRNLILSSAISGLPVDGDDVLESVVIDPEDRLTYATLLAGSQSALTKQIRQKREWMLGTTTRVFQRKRANREEEAYWMLRGLVPEPVLARANSGDFFEWDAAESWPDAFLWHHVGHQTLLRKDRWQTDALHRLIAASKQWLIERRLFEAIQAELSRYGPFSSPPKPSGGGAGGVGQGLPTTGGAIPGAGPVGPGLPPAGEGVQAARRLDGEV